MRKSLNATMREATPCEQIDLDGQKIPYTEDEKAETHFSLPVRQTSLKFSKQINADLRLDQELCAAEDKKRGLLSCVT